MKLIKLGLEVGVVAGIAKVIVMWIDGVHLLVIKRVLAKLEKIAEDIDARKKGESAVESESK